LAGVKTGRDTTAPSRQGSRRKEEGSPNQAPTADHTLNLDGSVEDVIPGRGARQHNLRNLDLTIRATALGCSPASVAVARALCLLHDLR